MVFGALWQSFVWVFMLAILFTNMPKVERISFLDEDEQVEHC